MAQDHGFRCQYHEASVTKWVFTIIRSKCLATWRASKRDAKRQQAEEQRIVDETRVRAQDTPEGQMQRWGSLELRQRAFERLSPIDKTLLKMYVSERFAAHDVAHFFGLSEAAVR